jgi:hypothetical protein
MDCVKYGQNITLQGSLPALAPVLFVFAVIPKQLVHTQPHSWCMATERE